MDKDLVDAAATTAEEGSVISILKPSFTVAVPKPDKIKIPAAYALRKGQHETADFINHWLELKKKDQTIDELYSHWVLGKSIKTHKRRWSVIKDVLKWVK